MRGAITVQMYNDSVWVTADPDISDKLKRPYRLRPIRISADGRVKDLIMVNGEPVILDRKGRVWGLDRSAFRHWLVRMRFAFPRGVIVGALVTTAAYGTGILRKTPLTPAELFAAAAAFDTLVVSLRPLAGIKAHRFYWLPDGVNFFRVKIASGVRSLEPSGNLGNYKMIFKDGHYERLSADFAAGETDCERWLVGLF